MAKMTLLAMVQDILSDMNSDEVNSYSDTVESLQVAQILKTTYTNIISERLWPREARRVALTALSDTDTPSHFKIPDNVQKISYIKYDVRDTVAAALDYTDIEFLDSKEFLDICLSRDSTASNIETITDTSDTKILIQNDADPSYWTTFDDEYVIFDSFDNTIDTTMQASKIICYAEVEPEWTDSDTFVPLELPAKAFPYLLAEAKSTAFINLKETPNAKIEQLAKRLRHRILVDRRVVGEIDRYPDYGRRV